MANSKLGTALAVGGMAMLLTGRKKTALTLFAKGFAELEKQWRENHPEFQGDFGDRWSEATKFYEATHAEKTNRVLHMVGIPMIVGGAVGLLAARPMRPVWMVAAGSFAAGWALNIVGHAVYEKNAPAFADDPLSFIAGPAWDLQQMLGKRGSKGGDVAPSPEPSPETRFVAQA